MARQEKFKHKKLLSALWPPFSPLLCICVSALCMDRMSPSTDNIPLQKGNHKQNEKTPYRLGENIFKWCNRQGLNYQNTQIFIQLNNKINNPIKTWAEDLSRCLSKKSIQMVNKHMKIYSTSLVIREKSKLQWGITSHWSIGPSLRKSANNKCWRGCRERGILLHCW